MEYFAIELNALHFIYYIMCKYYYSNNGVDYTQSKQRKKYIEQRFGEDPPSLEVLVIKGPEESIQHDSVASKLPHDSLHMK